MTLGEKIRVARLEQKLTQEQLAEAAGVDRNYIGQIERGERNVALVNIVTIAGALKVQPADLFTTLAMTAKRR